MYNVTEMANKEMGAMDGGIGIIGLIATLILSIIVYVDIGHEGMNIKNIISVILLIGLIICSINLISGGRGIKIINIYRNVLLR